jgi:site-specific recombinase XerD
LGKREPEKWYKYFIIYVYYGYLYHIFVPYLYHQTLAMTKINVTLRKRKSTAGGRQILYLDFYPAITVDGKQTRREYLGLFVYDHPRNPFDKEHNTRAMEEAEMKELRRKNELNKPEIYSELELAALRAKEIGEGSFTDFMLKFIKNKKLRSRLSYESMISHLYKYAGKKEVKFSEITGQFCEGFKKYLEGANYITSDERAISNTSSWHYLAVFKTVIRAAYNMGNFQNNPAESVGSIKKMKPRPKYLSMDELNKLAATPCDKPLVKRAALFSALTGLRFSDIEKLTWSEVEETESGYQLNFIQQKTGEGEPLPISQQAVALLGDRSQAKPFEGLRYSRSIGDHLNSWIASAGITKKITFHTFRHTNATLQLAAGTDIYTVSKLLGHKSLATTQIYTHVLVKAKRDAADRITINTTKP